MKVVQEDGKPIKMWTDHVPVEGEAVEQLVKLSKLPFIFKHLAVMPDCHVGKGSTVGTVIATQGAVIPAAVGVDIGCGMIAVKTSLTANDLPESLAAIRSDIEAAVPHGNLSNVSAGQVRGSHVENMDDGNVYNRLTRAFKSIGSNYTEVVPAEVRQNHHRSEKPWLQLGTLGGGNHFIELCLDLDGNVWIMLHSGSRGIGNKIGTYFISKAKEEMKRWYCNVPDADLAYLPEGTEHYNAYCDAVDWAQQYAMANRQVMLEAVLGVLVRHLPPFTMVEQAINCHHNYISKENHYGNNVMVTRKGAVRAQRGDLGIIPGSMGARSFIVRGLGNAESFNSCSHGAGRVMSRTEAKKRITLADHVEATKGIECRKDADVIDESPKAYKNIEDVMRSQADLVEIVAELRQVLCVKG